MDFDIGELITAENWADTGEIAPELSGASGSRKTRAETSQRIGIRKPGDPQPGSLEACREIVAFQIARWLNVSVPFGELYPYEGNRPCFISHILGPVALKWATVMQQDEGLPHRADATTALAALSPIIVLDALVGVRDRHNGGNYVYVPSEKRWYSIDYSYSFNVDGIGGVGDATLFDTQYFPEIISAATSGTHAIAETLEAAESIPDEAFAALFARIPEVFCPNTERERMLAFLKARRANLRQILQRWSTIAGHPEIVGPHACR